MRFRALLDDGSIVDRDDDRWRDDIPDRILKVWLRVVIDGAPTMITAVGWDRYFIRRTPAGLIFGVRDVDVGSMNRGRGVFFVVQDDGRQEWYGLRVLSAEEIDRIRDHEKRGVWVSDALARQYGIIE